MKWMQFLTPVAGMDPEEVRSYVRNHKEGTYTLLDVRQPSEYEKARIPGAKLIPLPELAGRLGELDSRKPVIAY
jgi:rhodanese-related sulfurtransferase